MIIDGVEMRGLRLEDAAGRAETLVRNREYMAPYEPWRDEDFYTEAGQRARIEGLLAEQEGGRARTFVLAAADGVQVGAINLQNIVRGPMLSASVGYWIDEAWTGRGLATAALHELCRIARDEERLHRVEAGTRVDNLPSQRVLEKAGFEPYGLAPRLLHVGGDWQDHRLFQLLLNDEPPAL